jgi:hypothetical protein
MGILEEMRDLLISIDNKLTLPTPPPSNNKWPNEPNWTKKKVLADWDMTGSPDGLYGDDPVGDQGFRLINNHPPGMLFGPDMGPEYDGTPCGYSLAKELSDAPYSPRNTYDFVYPKGMRLGTAPSTVYKAWSAAQNWGYREIYCAWMCKISEPFDYSTNGQKMCFLFNGGGGVGGQSFICIAPDKRIAVMPEYPDPDPSSPAYRIRYPNQKTGLVLMEPNTWRLIEWYQKLPEENTPSESSLKWWVDGMLQGNYNDVWNKFPMDMFQFSPTFGGNGNVYKTEEDHFYVDHVRIVVPE